MVGECLGKVNELGRKSHLALSSRTTNIPANSLAKIGAETPFTGSESFCGLGDVTCKNVLKFEEEHERAKLWGQVSGLVHSKKLLEGYNRERREA